MPLTIKIMVLVYQSIFLVHFTRLAPLYKIRWRRYRSHVYTLYAKFSIYHTGCIDPLPFCIPKTRCIVKLHHASSSSSSVCLALLMGHFAHEPRAMTMKL